MLRFAFCALVLWSHSVAAAGPIASTELNAALSSARGGDRIELAGGDYGTVSLRGVTFPSDVTIVSADPADPAVISNLNVRDSSHIVFDGILFDYVARSSDRVAYKAFQVVGSAFITIRNSIFDGDEVPSDLGSGEFGTGKAIAVIGSDNVVIEHNEIFNFWKAVSVVRSTDTVISYNDVHSMRTDGFNFNQVDGLLVEGNYLHDFKRLVGGRDHADMIQMWNRSGSNASQNIIIRGNFLDAGGEPNQWTQSILFRNATAEANLSDLSLYYKNILIEDNVIYNAHIHGITVGATDGLVIQNNTLLFDEAAKGNNPGSGAPRINLKDDYLNITVQSNISPRAVKGKPGWKIRQNLVVQSDRPGRKNYYLKLFANALDPNTDIADLRASPGGVIESLGLGAEMTRSGIAPAVGPVR